MKYIVYMVVEAENKDEALVKTAERIEKTMDLHDSMQVREYSVSLEK